MVDVVKSLSLCVAIEYSVFHQLVQAELNGVLDDSKDWHSSVRLVDADSIKVPQLRTELRVALTPVVDTTKISQLTAIGTEPGSDHRTVGIQADLLHDPFGETYCSGLSAHHLNSVE